MNSRFALPVSFLLVVAQCAFGADADKGARVFENQKCLECHTIGEQGSGHEPSPNAVELGRRLTSTYTAPALASVLWNHSPAMWRQIEAENVARSAPTESDWRDLFAYLYSVQFSEAPAAFQRGKEVLEGKHCVDCHSLSKDTAAGPARPVDAWQHVDDPVWLAYEMWNHAAAMTKDAAQSKRQWPDLHGQDLIDLTAYVRALQNRPRENQFSLPNSASGRAIFESNCAHCHQGSQSLSTKLRNSTWMDIGANMWNHAPKMQSVPALSVDDLSKILAYVWELQYQGSEGNADRGQKAFSEKRCVSCHTPGSLQTSKSYTAFSIAALGWGPARQIHQKMDASDVQWPYLSSADVADLVAFLNTPAAR
jgi:mono/diheme cytochrome c family protein